MEESSGYTALPKELLTKAGVQVGDRIRVELKRGTSQEVVEGLLMPRFQTSREENYIVVKLNTGYNIGVRVAPSTIVKLLGKGAEPHFTRPGTPEQKPGLPKVSIISTGGTIASRVDYRTGAVKPALDAEDLYSVVPELANVANIQA
jgi:glutamyl-tRNA(Gln) amidotransferase subunit D